MSTESWASNPDVAAAVERVAAMLLPQRPLDGQTLAEAQRQRESATAT